VVEARRLQRTFGDGLIAAEVSDLYGARMLRADAILADDAIVSAVYQALAQRYPIVASVVGKASLPRWCCVCCC
jgi:hypothetical protein